MWKLLELFNDKDELESNTEDLSDDASSGTRRSWVLSYSSSSDENVQKSETTCISEEEKYLDHIDSYAVLEIDQLDGKEKEGVEINRNRFRMKSVSNR